VRAHEIVAVTGALEVALRDASVACRFGFGFGAMLFVLLEPVSSKGCRYRKPASMSALEAPIVARFECAWSVRAFVLLSAFGFSVGFACFGFGALELAVRRGMSSKPLAGVELLYGVSDAVALLQKPKPLALVAVAGILTEQADDHVEQLLERFAGGRNGALEFGCHSLAPAVIVRPA
jgi:hypothetical protein